MPQLVLLETSIQVMLPVYLAPFLYWSGRPILGAKPTQIKQQQQKCVALTKGLYSKVFIS